MNHQSKQPYSDPEIAISKLLSVVEYIEHEAERLAGLTGKPRSRLPRAISIRYPSDPLNQLSQREHEVLLMFLRTGSIMATSRKMFISVNTVRTHIRSLRQKYEVASATELVCKAVGMFGDDNANA